MDNSADFPCRGSGVHISAGSNYWLKHWSLSIPSMVFGSTRRELGLCQRNVTELDIRACGGRLLFLFNRTMTIIDSIFNYTLNASHQLSQLNKQVAIKMTTLRIIRYLMSENTALLLYKATSLLIFDYNDVIYGLLSKQQQTKLRRTQNRALRTVFRGKTLSEVKCMIESILHSSNNRGIVIS